MLQQYKGDFAGLMALQLDEHMRAKLIDLADPGEFAKLSDEAIVALLLSESDPVRRASANKIPGSVTRTRVRTLLARYRTNEGRYYIVTYWLDLGLAVSRTVARRVAMATP